MPMFLSRVTSLSWILQHPLLSSSLSASAWPIKMAGMLRGLLLYRKHGPTPNLPRSHLSISILLAIQSLRNFAQSTTISLISCMQNFIKGLGKCKNVMGKRNFARFQLQMSFRWIYCIARTTCLTTRLHSCVKNRDITYLGAHLVFSLDQASNSHEDISLNGNGFLNWV